MNRNHDNRGGYGILLKGAGLDILWDSLLGLTILGGVISTYITVRILTVSIAFLLFATTAPADSEEQDNYITITYENDVFFGKDGGYTNGIGVFWAHGTFDEFNEEVIPRWVNSLTKNLPISTTPGKVRAVSYAVGQSMQTADDITIKELVPEDAPYMGLLGWKGTLHAFDDTSADKISLFLGVVGPVSGAEYVQKFVHSIMGVNKPEGWAHQLNNEPVFRLSADRSWRLANKSFERGTGFDVIGVLQGGGGTLRSDIGAGISFRYGRNLSRTFPAVTFIPGREVNPLAGMDQYSWNVFLNVLGRYVFNDISIDGNTFTDSHSVELIHDQYFLTAGISFNFGDWAFLLSTVRGSDHYETQDTSTKFGSLSVTFRY